MPCLSSGTNRLSQIAGGAALFTTISSWATAIWRTLEAQDVDPGPIFSEVGLDPALLTDPGSRYPRQAILKLWGRSMDASGDPCFVIRVAAFVHPTTFHALGYAWLVSFNLADAMRKAVRYGQVVTTGSELSLEASNEEYALLLVPLEEAQGMRVPREVPDAGLAAILQMCRLSAGDRFNPLRVTTIRPEPSCADRYFDFFRAPIEFSASHYSLIFDRGALEAPLLTGNPQLALCSERALAEQASRAAGSSTGLQVRNILMEWLPSGRVGIARIADGLHMSQTNLKRKLKEEATSYKAILDETRRELAAAYLKDMNLSIGEIAYLLGFTEPANFARSFTRWHGISPSVHRKSLTTELGH